jgi:flavin reductase (NADH)
MDPSSPPQPQTVAPEIVPTETLVDAATFRNCLRHVPGAVAIITTVHDGVRAGLTATAVCSVSAEPPQMLVCVNRSASASPVITAAGRFGISFLAHDQRAIANAFSGPAADRFASASWSKLETGIPLLDGAAASFECVVVQAIQSGTHTIFIGAVVAALANPGPNLVYKSGDFMVV